MRIVLRLIAVSLLVIPSLAQAGKNSESQCLLPDGKKVIVRYSQSDRTGTLITEETLVSDSTSLPKGRYIIRTVSAPDRSMMVISKAEQPAKEMARISMSVTRLGHPVESSLALDVTPTGCIVRFRGRDAESSLAFNLMNTDVPNIP
jgi:hypothetical protein